MMNSDSTLFFTQQITNHLYMLSNSATAEHSQRFFKTGEGEYGHGDKFLGIRVPILRKLVKQYQNVPLTVSEKLLQSEYHEVRLFGLLLMVARFPKATEEQQQEMFDIYLRNTAQINNWDLVDVTAPHIVGAFLEDRDRAILHELAKSESLWERRISIISTHHFIKQDQFGDTLKIAKLLLKDEEDLIHKAVGWMLREVGKRDQQREEKFLQTGSCYKKMPRTMLRYAIERFDEYDRQRYLHGEV